jgi:hypothetical protein
LSHSASPKHFCILNFIVFCRLPVINNTFDFRGVNWILHSVHSGKHIPLSWREANSKLKQTELSFTFLASVQGTTKTDIVSVTCPHQSFSSGNVLSL